MTSLPEKPSAAGENWYNQGNDFCNNGEFNEAIQCYLLAANMKHIDSLNELGYLYRVGKGVEKDYKKSIEWYSILDKNCGNTGNHSAQLCIADMYREGGPGLNKNFELALIWYKKAIDNIYYSGNNNYAYSCIGQLFQTGGPGIQRSYGSAIYWYEKCCSDDYFKMIVASFYREGGHSVDKNYVKAIVWYCQVKDEKYTLEANFYMGLMFQKGGHGITKDYKEALVCYKKASDDRSDACIYIGHIYRAGGYGVRQDQEKALEWYTSALERGDKSAREYLDKYYKIPIVLPTAEELREEQKKLQKAYKKILSLKAELELNDAGVRDLLNEEDMELSYIHIQY